MVIVYMYASQPHRIPTLLNLHAVAYMSTLLLLLRQYKRIIMVYIQQFQNCTNDAPQKYKSNTHSVQDNFIL